MKSHHAFQQIFGILDIDVKQVIDKQPLSKRAQITIAMVFIAFGIALLATYVQFIFISTSVNFQEYIFTIYVTSTATTTALLFTLFIGRHQQLSKFIVNVDDVLQESE